MKHRYMTEEEIKDGAIEELRHEAKLLRRELDEVYKILGGMYMLGKKVAEGGDPHCEVVCRDFRHVVPVPEVTLEKTEGVSIATLTWDRIDESIANQIGAACQTDTPLGVLINRGGSYRGKGSIRYLTNLDWGLVAFSIELCHTDPPKESDSGQS